MAVIYGPLVLVCYCGLTLISRFGLTSSSLTIWDLAALRFDVGGLLLLPVFFRWKFKGVGRVNAFVLASLGGLCFALTAYVGFTLAPTAPCSSTGHSRSLPRC